MRYLLAVLEHGTARSVVPWCGPKPVRFFAAALAYAWRAVSSMFQEKLFAPATVTPGTTVVNDRVTILTSEQHRIVCVDGLAVHHYAVGDRMAEAYAMVMLADSRYASQNDVARSFGYTSRTLRRAQERFEERGLQALGKPAGRPAGSRSLSEVERLRDQTILRLKSVSTSNREIARQLGVNEKAIRKRLRRLGWRPATKQLALLEVDDARAPEQPSVGNSGSANTSKGANDQTLPEHEEPLPTSFDVDPLNRFVDRLLAALGALDDAAPLFASSPSVARAGVLVAIPPLVQSGLLSIASEIFGSIGPAFYGLRTTLVVLVLLALLRIKRPESVKEYAPLDLGRIFGLDRAPEVKTLRRKLTRLAQRGCAVHFGRELAKRRVAERGRTLGFLYVDGHVRVYHGKRKIPKAYVTRLRLALPATTDYWVNDKRGDPLFVVTAEANAAMTKMLPRILEQVRTLLGPKRRVTVVFDRGGWSPKLFVKLIDAGFDILTYRKGRVRRISQHRFVLRHAKLDGRRIKYLLHDQAVRFLKGKLRLRQVTRLTDGGHQTPVLTSRWDLRDIVIAYRMFERWRQENFFKYLREEYLIDALVDYQVEAEDPTRLAPNPAWRQADKELRAARAELAKLEVKFGRAAIANKEGRRRPIKRAREKLGKEIRAARDRVAKLKAIRDGLRKQAPLGEILSGQQIVKLSTERKHLTNILKMVAFQIESDLLHLLRPHYARVDDEGRTLLQTAFQSAAAIDAADDELRVTLAPLSSAHRSKAIAALCDAVNKTETPFPGSSFRMRYGVTGPAS